ncbi:MAG: type I methionyl aminopeptidase [Actinobacteria bacterium]|nr:type I methionyl aminopeptidase [Actinomycetota bacterium]
MIIRKGPEEIERIARAGALVAETIDHVGRHIEPGITTGELDIVAEDFIRAHGGIPTSKGYGGDKGHVPFPGAICLSPNEVVVHGIPGRHVVRDGDVLTVDVGVTLDGSIADSAYTYAVGEVADEVVRLLETAQSALGAGIVQARLGNRVGDISNAIQQVVEEAGFSVVRSLVGHGVGRYYHEAPHIPNFGQPGRGPKLAEGMTIAIEPMITAGAPGVHMWADGWTIATDDGSMSAHFEHTVAITAAGPRVLTPRVGIAVGGAVC